MSDDMTLDAFAAWWGDSGGCGFTEASEDADRAAWDAATERAARSCVDAANDLNNGLRRDEFHSIDARLVEAQVAILKLAAARIRGGTP